MVQKRIAILFVAVVLIISIISFFIGFFVSSNYFSAGKILHGTKDNLIGTWNYGSSEIAKMIFCKNGSCYSGGNWGTFVVVGDKLTMNINSPDSSIYNATFYFINNYDKLAIEAEQPSNIYGAIACRK